MSSPLLILFRRATRSPVVVPPTLLAAIRLRLLGVDDLVAGLSGVHAIKVPRAAALPFLVINPITSEPTHNNGGVGYWESVTVQFTLVAQDDMAATRLGQLALQALTPTPRNPPLVFADGYDMGRWPGVAQLADRPGQGPGGRPVWYYRFEFDFLVGRAY